MNYIIQIGTYDRIDENLKFYLGKEEYFCILVEGNKEAYDKILKELKPYKNFSIFNILVSDFDGKRNFYLYRNEELARKHNESFGTHSVYKEHLIDFGLGEGGSIEEVSMPCVTLETLCKMNNIDKEEIHLLMIDTDRHDCDILLATDFSQLKINRIIFEYIHSDGTYTQGKKLDRTLSHLKNHGYEVSDFDASNFMAVKKNEKNNITHQYGRFIFGRL